MPPPFPPEADASEDEQNERLDVLKQATLEQSATAEVQMMRAYDTFRNYQDELLSKYLPVTPVIQFAVHHYYTYLKKIIYDQENPKRNTEAPLLGELESGVVGSELISDAATSSPTTSLSNPKRSGTTAEVVVSPVRRKNNNN